MNILFVHEVDWIRKVIFEIHTLSELLSLMGHTVYAVDYESMWTKNSFWDFGTLKTREADITRVYPKATVKLVRPGLIKIPVISRASATLTQYLAIQRVLKKNDIDVVVLYSAPTNGIQTINLCKKLGIPVVFRSIDVLHRLVRNGTLSRMTKTAERKVYAGADLILTITQALSQYVSRMEIPSGKMKVVPLGVDTEAFQPEPQNGELRRWLGLGAEDKVIMFAGTLPRFSGLDTFIRAAQGTLLSRPNTKLVIVGGGEQETKLQTLIGELRLRKQVIITGLQPHSTMPSFINLADVCVNTFPIMEATRDIFPTKVVQYMACGKPVVSTPLKGLTAMDLGVKQGMLYAGTADAMIEVVVELLDSDDHRQKLGQAALKYAQSTHDYKVVAKRVETELIELVGRRKRQWMSFW